MIALALPLVVLAAFLGSAWVAAAVWFPIWGAVALRAPPLARGSVLAAALPTALAVVLVIAAVLPVDPHDITLGCHCAASSPGWMHLCPLHPAAAAPLLGPALALALLLGPGRVHQLLRVARGTRPLGTRTATTQGSGLLILPLSQRTALVEGILHPRVVVDRALWEALEPDDRTVVLAHEQGHIERGDPMILALLGVLCALGPRPAGDLLVRTWLRRAEFAADRAAAAAVGDSVRVAEVLLRCARLQQGEPLALSWGGGTLEHRVHHLLQIGGRPQIGGRDLALADILVLVTLLITAIAAGGALHHPIEHLLNLGR